MMFDANDDGRADHLLRKTDPVLLTRPLIPPAVQGVPIRTLTLESRAPGPRWIITLADGTTRQASPETGTLLPILSAAEATQEVMVRYMGAAEFAKVSRTEGSGSPAKMRRDEAWQVEMSDGTLFEVDAGSGTVVQLPANRARFPEFVREFHIANFFGS